MAIITFTYHVYSESGIRQRQTFINPLVSFTHKAWHEIKVHFEDHREPNVMSFFLLGKSSLLLMVNKARDNLCKNEYYGCNTLYMAERYIHRSDWWASRVHINWYLQNSYIHSPVHHDPLVSDY
jgi:hypothetical protein